jgi:flagellar biosynthesis/type III secretory pathway protein FliH
MAQTHVPVFEPGPPLGAENARFEPAGIAGGCFVADPAAELPPYEPARPTAADLEARERAAFERGVSEGRAALPWREAEALATALAALEQTARKLGALRRGYLIECRSTLVELACAIAERILDRAPDLRSEALAALVLRALEATAPEARPIVVRVAPVDHATLLAARPAPESLAIECDASLPPGEAHIATRNGDVRASVAIALEQIGAALREALDAQDSARETEEAP